MSPFANLCLLVMEMDDLHHRYVAARKDKKHGYKLAVPLRLRISKVHTKIIQSGLMTANEVMDEFTKFVPHAQV